MMPGTTLASYSRHSTKTRSHPESAVRAWFEAVLIWLGIEPRAFLALSRAMILRDLRGQHYAAATASKVQQIFSPLHIVVGQFLTTSVLCCCLLFARVEVFFFVFVNLCLGFLLLASAIIVE